MLLLSLGGLAGCGDELSEGQGCHLEDFPNESSEQTLVIHLHNTKDEAVVVQLVDGLPSEPAIDMMLPDGTYNMLAWYPTCEEVVQDGECSELHGDPTTEFRTIAKGQTLDLPWDGLRASMVSECGECTGEGRCYQLVKAESGTYSLSVRYGLASSGEGSDAEFSMRTEVEFSWPEESEVTLEL